MYQSTHSTAGWIKTRPSMNYETDRGLMEVPARGNRVSNLQLSWRNMGLHKNKKSTVVHTFPYIWII